MRRNGCRSWAATVDAFGILQEWETFIGGANNMGQLVTIDSNLHGNPGAPPVEHYQAYRPRPFTREQREETTILFGGLTWKHERLMQGALHNLKYKAEP